MMTIMRTLEVDTEEVEWAWAAWEAEVPLEVCAEEAEEEPWEEGEEAWVVGLVSLLEAFISTSLLIASRYGRRRRRWHGKRRRQVWPRRRQGRHG